MNPHPTRSKPYKPGRKHTGSPSLRSIGKRLVGEKIETQKHASRRKRYAMMVAAFWRGEIERHP